MLTRGYPTRDLPAEFARWSTITQIYEGTNQIQRMVMAGSYSNNPTWSFSVNCAKWVGRN